MKFFRQGHAAQVFQAQRHPPQLLEKKLAGARGALVATLNMLNAPILVELVDHEGFPPGGDHGAIGVIGRQDKTTGQLHRFRFGNVGQGQMGAKFATGGRDLQLGRGFNFREHLLERQSRVALMGALASQDNLSLAAGVLSQPHQRDGRRPQAYTQSLHIYSSE